MMEKITAKIREPKYKQIIDLNDERINVLLLGASGCGKSTLINSLLGADMARTGAGQAITKDITVYESDELPFRMIDTVGYEYGFLKQNKIKKDLARFSKEGVKKKEVDKLVHMIWYCIDGTVKRIDQVVLDYMKSVTNDWKDVPVIIVFTKSYSETEIAENIQMAKDAILKYNETHKRKQIDVRAIVPVVAKAYQINDTVSVVPRGLDVLISKTNELIPEAKKLAESSIKEIDVKLKRSMTNSIIGISTASAVTVGAVPIPFPDASILVPIQSGMMTGIAKIYDISVDTPHD